MAITKRPKPTLAPVVPAEERERKIEAFIAGTEPAVATPPAPDPAPMSTRRLTGPSSASSARMNRPKR